MRSLMLLVMVLAISLPLSACGKKGKLEAPQGTEGEYPRKYPQQ